jgi:hypothetical protein
LLIAASNRSGGGPKSSCTLLRGWMGSAGRKPRQPIQRRQQQRVGRDIAGEERATRHIRHTHAHPVAEQRLRAGSQTRRIGDRQAAALPAKARLQRAPCGRLEQVVLRMAAREVIPRRVVRLDDPQLLVIGSPSSVVRDLLIPADHESSAAYQLPVVYSSTDDGQLTANS